MEELLSRAKLECKVLGFDKEIPKDGMSDYEKKKIALAKKWESMTPEEREEWRLKRNAYQRKYYQTTDYKVRISEHNRLRYQERKKDQAWYQKQLDRQNERNRKRREDRAKQEKEKSC